MYRYDYYAEHAFFYRFVSGLFEKHRKSPDERYLIFLIKNDQGTLTLVSIHPGRHAALWTRYISISMLFTSNL